MDNPTSIQAYEKMREAFHALQLSKPNDRSETDRNHAITLTEYQKVLAFFWVWVVMPTETAKDND